MPEWGPAFLVGCVAGAVLGVLGCLLMILYEEAQWEDWFRRKWR